MYSITYLRYFFKNSIDTKTQIINVNFANIIVAASGRKIDTREKKKGKKRTLPSQHLILNIDDNLAAPREMRVWRRRLFEFGETSWSALLIQYLLLLKAFYLEPRFVPLIVNPRKYQHVQNQQTASDRDRHAQSCRVRGISTKKKKKNINYLLYPHLYRYLSKPLSLSIL